MLANTTLMAQPNVFAQPRPTPSTNNFDLMRAGRPVPIPQHQESYESLCKVLLRMRLNHMYLLAGFTAFVALLCAVFDPKELPGSLFNFLPVLLYTTVAFLGAVPVFVLRKQTLTTTFPTAASRFAQWTTLLQPVVVPVFLAYAVGSVPLFYAYLWCASSVSQDPRIGLTFYHEGRDSQQLNERFIYLALLHTTLVLYSTVSHVVSNRSRLEFEDKVAASIPKRLVAQIQARLVSRLRDVAVVNAVFFSAYIVLRWPALRFLVGNFAGSTVRPYLYSVVKYNAAYSVTLVVRALASSFVTLVVWEAAHTTFEVYATQPMLVSHYAAKPNQALVSGVKSSDPYFQHFALLELSTLSLTNEARRKSIFSDIKLDGTTGGAWHEILRECLALIETEMQRAAGKGVTQAKEVPGSEPLTPSRSSQFTPVPVKHADIFRPTKPTFLETLTATKPSPSKPPTAISSAVAPATPNGTLHRVPSVFSFGTPTTAKVVDIAPVTPAKVVKSTEETIRGYLPRALREASFVTSILGTRPSYVVGKCVPRRHEVACALQALAYLLCASLKEDPYGVVQRDIPKILEQIVLYLIELETLEKALLAPLSAQGKKSELEAMSEEIRLQLSPVQEAAKDALRIVLDEFSPFMSEFSFPPRIAAKLQVLVDWG